MSDINHDFQNLSEAEHFRSLIESRRSVRKYLTDTEFDHDAVQRSLELALLSPNSSNMQLWAFHRVIDKNKKTELARICMGQNAARTASELVAFVVTPDKWKGRAEVNAANVRDAFGGRDDKTALRAFKYYEKLIPMVYRNDRLGLLGVVRKIICTYLGRKKPIFREVMKADLRVCLHKSSSLAAMTFMTAMRAEGYDTCAMEGFDSKRAKALLNLDKNDEITMIVSCGLRAEDGIYSKRQRVDSRGLIIKH